jgi:hypothetical protein
MALRDILVCLDATAAGDGRLELALNLAQANKAHLTAVYALPEPRGSAGWPASVGLPPTVLGPVSPEGARAIGGQPISAAAPVAQVLREAERVDTVEQRFREELPLRALDGEWHMLDHTDLAELIQLAKAADLAILGQYPGDDSDGVTWLRPDDLMIDSGRPVLVVPYAGTFERVGRRVLVAWDGTREANRALHDALPLIGGAEAVTVMHVGVQQADLDRDRPWLLYGTVPDLVPADRRESAFGVFYTGTIGAGALSPVLYGLFSDAIGLTPAMLLVAAIVLLTLPLAWKLTRVLRAVAQDPRSQTARGTSHLIWRVMRPKVRFARDSLLEEEGFEPSATTKISGICSRTLRLLRLSPSQLDTMGGYYGEGTEDASRTALARFLPGAKTHPEGAASRRPARSISDPLLVYGGPPRGGQASSRRPG